MAKSAHRTPPPKVHTHFPVTAPRSDISRTPPTGHVQGPPVVRPAGSGTQLSLNNPFGAPPPGIATGAAPGQPPGQPPIMVEMQGDSATPGTVSLGKAKKASGRRPRSGSETQADTGGGG